MTFFLKQHGNSEPAQLAGTMQYRKRQISIVAALTACSLVGVIALNLGLERKLFWAMISTAITIAGYAIYISQMYPAEQRPAAKPEPLTWLLFGFLTATGAIPQLTQGGDVGSVCLVITAAACFLIAGLSYWRWRSEWRFDRLHLGTAIAALALFGFCVLTSREPKYATASAVLATAADLASYAPTFRKAWTRPHEDSVTNFLFNSVKCIPALLALRSYSIATMIYLLMLTIVNAGFAIFLIVRRSHLGMPGSLPPRRDFGRD